MNPILSSLLRKPNSVQIVMMIFWGLLFFGMLVAGIMSGFPAFMIVVVLVLLMITIFVVYFFRTEEIDKARGKSGWGWILLWAVYFWPQTSQAAFTGYVMTISGILSMFLYFLFRQRILFNTIQRAWLRSLVSGIIATCIAIPLV